MSGPGQLGFLVAVLGQLLVLNFDSFYLKAIGWLLTVIGVAMIMVGGGTLEECARGQVCPRS